MQAIALAFSQLPYGIVERGPQRKEGKREGGMEGKKKKSPETKLLADEIDLCSQLGKRKGEGWEGFWNINLFECRPRSCSDDSSGRH